MKRKVEDALDEAAARISSDDFVRAILTGVRRAKKPEFLRVDLRPVKLKDDVLIQVVTHDGKKDFTKNVPLRSAEILALLQSGFANVIVESTSESYQVQITKKEEAISGTSRTKLERKLEHDHVKERAVPESDPIFRALQMSDEKGRIKPSFRDKYIQIDQLIRLLEPALEGFTKGSELKVVDLASGSGALTLAVHRFLSQDFAPKTIGIERNPDLALKSRMASRRAQLTGIDFQESEIASVTSDAEILLALHACDTATDDAIDLAIDSKVKVALIVPCCQQSRSAESKELASLLPFYGKDGIIDERLLDLATDAARGERLRKAGYSVDIVEFVSGEHTGRNLLIRARKR